VVKLKPTDNYVGRPKWISVTVCIQSVWQFGWSNQSLSSDWLAVAAAAANDRDEVF